MDQTRERHASPGYQFLMLVLCLYTLAILAVQTAVRLAPGTRGVLDAADYAVCVIFFADFIFELARAKNRVRYFVTWGWLDLLSSIPTIHLARWARTARVVRIFRILRGLRATRLIAMLVIRKRARSAFLAASLIALLLVVFCSIAILHAEAGADSNIKTAEDAIWWAFATITTVGYGDRFPVTSEGRFVGAILMCSGVGLFGTFSAFLTSWFIGPGDADRESAVSLELRTLTDEVRRLRELIELRSDHQVGAGSERSSTGS
jgi:voltage-gated potassium channel